MKIKLSPLHAGDSSNLQVENWPFDVFHIEDGEVEPDSSGEVRVFDGSGDWNYEETEDENDEPFGKVVLHFDAGTPKDDVPGEPQELMVGGSPEHPELYNDLGLGTCGVTTFRK
ncbi:hypothetical protein ACZ90_31405 [Streptomyces albus subsp. albus]|nr:hypothetical protein ACZ90_31405 [Streptomyces albus subsp. albus]